MTVTLQQMLSQRNILRVVSEVAKPATPLCNFYGVQRGSSADRGLPGSDMFFWDTFDYSRVLAATYQPEQPPPVSQETAPRMNTGRFTHIAERMQFLYDRLQPFRPLGKPDGTIDSAGQDWIARQIKQAVQRIDNTREYMLSQILSVGSFNLRQEGECMVVVPTSDTSGNYFNVDFGIPAAHKSQLNVFGAGNIISATWATASNDIPKQLFALHAASERKYGIPVTECWINTTTFNALRINNYMTMGSLSSGSFIIYKSMSKEPANNDYMQQGAFDVVFHAMPFITFHVINRSYIVGSRDETQYTGTTYNLLTVPDNVAIFTPRPSRDWISVAEGSRTIRPRPNDGPQLQYGFHTYEVPMHGVGAAGVEKVVADSFLIYLLSRYAIYIATVIF